MAGYGFVTQGSTGVNRSTRDRDPYQDVQAAGGGTVQDAPSWGNIGGLGPTGLPMEGSLTPMNQPEDNSAFSGSAPVLNSDGSVTATSAISSIARPTDYGDTIGWWGNEDNREAGSAYATYDLPFQQAMYNQAVSNREFTENQDRWNREFGQSQWRDDVALNQANRQFAEDQRASLTAEGQWNQNFSAGRTDADRDYSAGRTDADRRYGLDTTSEANRYALGNLEAGIADRYNQGRITNAAESNRLEGIYNQGRITNEAEANRLAGIYNQGRLTNEAEANRFQNSYNQGRLSNERIGFEIEREKQGIDQMYKQGLISNQQRDLALQELTQRQNNAFRQNELAQQNTQFGQTLEATRDWRNIQAALQREQMQRAYDTAVMQQTGRNQAPNVRWLRG